MGWGGGGSRRSLALDGEGEANRQLLVETCALTGMVVLNSLYSKKDCKKVTYRAPGAPVVSGG
eukprot:14133276-Alexandrium_andersonii.AAC.1